MSSQPQDQKQTGHTFDPVILREYDIRGIVGENLWEQDAYALGLAFGTLVSRNGGARVCVGYDGRSTSQGMAKALIKGLSETGMDVENIGLGPTPMLYFAVKDKMADGGIMITGSHNPGHYNGFKMTLQGGPVFGDQIQEIGKIAAAGDFAKGQGAVREVDLKQTYVERLIRDLKPGRNLKIAWDAGNGSTGEILHLLAKRLPGEHILLYDDIDGSFPNHHPDPTVDKNLEDLQRLVKEQSCDLGIAFDGDGDRIGVVDENGNILRCDMLMAIYIREVLEDLPGASIIGDVKCSKVMFEEIARLGGTPVMWKTGHSLIKAKMAEENAPLAGELSGHIFFADKYYGFDDALYCAIRLMNAAADTEEPFSSLTAHLPRLYSTPEIRIEVDESEKFSLVPKIIDNLKAANDPEIELNDIDGIRVSNENGWWLIRPSNTQNVLVSRIEADSPDSLKSLKEMVEKEVAKIGYQFTFET